MVNLFISRGLVMGTKVSLLSKDTLSRIKETEEASKKKIEEAEKKKHLIIDQAKTKSIELISEADKQDNDFREKELQKAKDRINKQKEKLIQQNSSSIESLKNTALKKAVNEAKFVVKKFSEEVFSD